MKPYRVVIEVSAPLAMFARPDTGGAPTSYPAPTWSAAKGLLEAIAFYRHGEAWFHPTRVEILKRRGEIGGAIRFQRYTTNYGGPLRHPKNVGTPNGQQQFATVLADVAYRIHAEIRGPSDHGGGVNRRHALKAMFERRLAQGQCFRAPAMGWREFTCDYVGAPREDITEVDTGIDLEVPAMLFAMWDRPISGALADQFVHDVRIERGVLLYPEVRHAA